MTAGPLPRRTLLASAAVLAAGAGAVARAAEQANLLVAGPDGGWLSAWSATLARPLLHGLPAGSRLSDRPVGGADGVTGANRFEAQFDRDGTRLMLLPGTAALAWLAGDPRVHFDAAHWLPLLCGVSTSVLACRRPLDAGSASTPLRMAVDGPLGPGAAALLALDLIGVPATPVRGLANPQAALAAGRIDAAFLPGQAGTEAGAALPGMAARYCLGAPDAMAEADPLLPTLAGLVAKSWDDRGRGDATLLAAWRAAAAAAQLDYALVMAPLSEPASVALWRQAAATARGAMVQAGVQPGFRPGIRSLAAPGCNTVLGAIATDSAALLAYRRWLETRLTWQPG